MRPLKNDAMCHKGTGPTQELSLRVSVATLARVMFTHPENGEKMLALERKATLVDEGIEKTIEVKAQPFGGAVRIKEVNALKGLLGEFQFDSEGSRAEMDFRIFINPTDWSILRQFCVQHLKDVDDPVLEADPGRELIEEFMDCLDLRTTREQFTSKPRGTVVEEDPSPTANIRARGFSTARVYRIFTTHISDKKLARRIITESNRFSDEDLEDLARLDKQKGGEGRANRILALPLDETIAFYSHTSLQERNSLLDFGNYHLSEAVLALLDEIDVPKYQRL